MTGHYFECDLCHLKSFSEHPEPGWVGMTRVLTVSNHDEKVAVEEFHACSTLCAIHLLSPIDLTTRIQ